MDHTTRRAVLERGAALGGVALAACLGSPEPGDSGGGPFLSESFESGMGAWEPNASIGPEEPTLAFEWRIDRSRAYAAEGEWSLEVVTEGDHDDGTAWAVRELSPPPETSAFAVELRAWSPSESFNTLRHLVASLGPERPTDEGSFPDPGANSSTIEDAPYGGLREPLHLAEGWREYGFEWDPASVPETLYLAVGVSVVWEADATHYLDAIEVEAE